MKTKERTMREWLERLKPKEVSEKALKYANPKYLDTGYNKMSDALASAFSFVRTSEGFNYWYDILHKLELKNK